MSISYSSINLVNACSHTCFHGIYSSKQTNFCLWSCYYIFKNIILGNFPKIYAKICLYTSGERQEYICLNVKKLVINLFRDIQRSNGQATLMGIIFLEQNRGLRKESQYFSAQTVIKDPPYLSENRCWQQAAIPMTLLEISEGENHIDKGLGLVWRYVNFYFTSMSTEDTFWKSASKQLN